KSTLRSAAYPSSPGSGSALKTKSATLTRNPCSSTPATMPCAVNWDSTRKPPRSMPDATTSTRSATANTAATTRCASGPASATAARCTPPRRCSVPACIGLPQPKPATSSAAVPKGSSWWRGSSVRRCCSRGEGSPQRMATAACDSSWITEPTTKPGRMYRTIAIYAPGPLTRRGLLELDLRRRAARRAGCAASLGALHPAGAAPRVVFERDRDRQQQLTLRVAQVALRLGGHHLVERLA